MKRLVLLVLVAACSSPPVDDDMGCSMLAGNNYGISSRVISARHVGWFWRCDVELPVRERGGVLQYERHVGTGTWDHMTWSGK